MRREEPITGLSRPSWFIQLWINSILKKHLRPDMRFFPPRALEDARLIYYTPTKKPLENSFKIFIEVLQITTEFTKDLAPFALSTIIGPLCLKKFFLADTLGEQAKLMEMWSSFLT